MSLYFTRVLRAMVAVFCTVLLAFFVAACGGGSGSSTTPTPTPTQAKPTPTTPPSASLTTFTGNGFTIGYPAGWKVTKTNTQVQFEDPTSLYSFAVVITPNPGGLASADQILTASVDALKKQFKNAQDENVSPTTTVAGESWSQKAVSGTSEVNGQSADVELILISVNHPASSPSTVNFSMVYGTAKALMPVAVSTYFQPMLNSFKFTS